MSQTPYVIAGVPGGVYPRMEVRDLQSKYPEQFTLFILGWQAIRQADYQPIAAQHVQISGIHGKPYERWPGDPTGPDKPIGGNDYSGYCHHASVLFPTWHRPFVMAIEQSICEAGRTVAEGFAKQYPAEAQKWRDAAKALRLPFWDWTLEITHKEGVPTVLKPGMLTLVMPEKKTIQMENILAHYNFGGKIPKDFSDFKQENPLVPPESVHEAYYSTWDSTYRWPSDDKFKPTEDYTSIDKILMSNDPDARAGWLDLRSKVAHLFTFPPNDKNPDNFPFYWDEFSNTRFQSSPHAPSPGMAGGLEQPHNSVHLLMGGIGAMGDNDYAGFDPVFWLHHCNVDRILALWEYVYPQYWLGDGFKVNGKLEKFTEQTGTWSEPNDAPIDQKTTLDPFRINTNTYWSPNDARGLGVDSKVPKNYTYPPVEGVQVDKAATPEERAKYVGVLQRHFGLNPVKDRDRLPPFKPSIFVEDVLGSIPIGMSPIKNYRHWIFQVELLEHAFNMSYSLEIYYTNAQGRHISIGSVAVLGKGSVTTQCGGCQGRRAAGNKVKGVIAMPADIVFDMLNMENLNVQGISINNIVDGLRKLIKAKLITPNGSVIASAQHGRNAGAGRGVRAEAIPTINFVSANVALPQGGGVAGAMFGMAQAAFGTATAAAGAVVDGAFRFYDVATHGGLLGDNWESS